MTIAIPIHRAFSTKLAPRGFNVVTRWGYNPWLARVNSTTNNDNGVDSTRLCLRSQSRSTVATRFYATGSTAKPASRPKAHTGRTPAKRSTKASTSSKPGPKTPAGKKAVGRKPKTKKPKAATKPKPKKQTTKKPPSATSLLAKRRVQDKELKQKALLDSPKKLPATAWAVIFSEAQTKGQPFSQASNVTKEAAQKLRNLTPEEKEHYNHVANQNKAANDAAYQKWISSHTPEQVREANTARQALKRQYKEAHPKAKSVNKFAPLKDDRLVLHPLSSFVLFTKDRHASGDFKHMTVSESAKLIGREWKALNATEKKKYEEQGEAESRRYDEEYTTVYGHAPQKLRTKAS